jgi:hypothetical protein
VGNGFAPKRRIALDGHSVRCRVPIEAEQLAIQLVHEAIAVPRAKHSHDRASRSVHGRRRRGLPGGE